MTEDLADHLALRDDGDEPQRPLMAKRAAGHIHIKDPLADKKNSATRQGWSKGIGGGDTFMKLCPSSSGCETRPAKGEPARAGSKPCDGARNGSGDA